jgi:hypothetical protein
MDGFIGRIEEGTNLESIQDVIEIEVAATDSAFASPGKG